MKPFLIGFVFLLLLVVSMGMFVANLDNSTGKAIKSVREGNTHVIDITSNGFTPSLLYINSGDTIIWQNYDLSFHTVTSEEWASELFDYQDSFSLTYISEYGIEYFSMINPEFKGKIIVLN